MLKYAFLICFPGSDSKKHRAVIETPTLSATVVVAKDFDDAANVAKSLVEDGVQLIDLCGAYGPVGAAKIVEAVGNKIPVGSVNYGIESTEKLAALLKEGTV